MINEASGLCLDDPGSSTTSGTQLDISTCNGETEQSWPLPVAQASPAPPPVGPVFDGQVFSDDGVPCLDDYKGITSVQGNPIVGTACEGLTEQTWTLEANGAIEFKGKCLDTAGGGTASGTDVVLDKCTGASSQDWQPGASYALIDQASGLCLTDPMDVTGTQLEIESCAATLNQQWRLPTL